MDKPNNLCKVINNYQLVEVIGTGQYGEVYRGIHPQKRLQKAIKVIKLSKFQEVPKLGEFIINETKALTYINHPNVIKLEETFQSQNHIYLIYEYCEGGTLEELIKKKGHLSEGESLNYLYQILAAFETLYQNHILHRDLKPSNILFKQNVLKVADFGFCKTLNSHFDLSQTMVGSPIYMAPEILFGQPYTIKADIWSIGIVMYEMLFGKCPYFDYNIQSLMYKIENIPLDFPRRTNPISKQSENLVRQMLVVKAEYRIEWNQLLSFQNSNLGMITGGSKGINLSKKKPPMQPVKSREQRATFQEPRYQNWNYQNDLVSRRETENIVDNKKKYSFENSKNNNHTHSEKKIRKKIFGSPNKAALSPARNIDLAILNPAYFNENLEQREKIKYQPTHNEFLRKFDDDRRPNSFIELKPFNVQNFTIPNNTANEGYRKNSHNSRTPNRYPEPFEGIWGKRLGEGGSFVENRPKNLNLDNFPVESTQSFKLPSDNSYTPKHIQDIIKNHKRTDFTYQSVDPEFGGNLQNRNLMPSNYRSPAFEPNQNPNGALDKIESIERRRKKMRVMREVLNRLTEFPLDNRSSLLMSLHLSRRIVAEGKMLQQEVEKFQYSSNSYNNLSQGIENEVARDREELSKYRMTFQQRYGFGGDMGDFSEAEEKYFKEISLDYSKKLREMTRMDYLNENEIYFLAFSLLMCADNRPEEIPSIPIQDKTFLKESVMSLESKLSSTSTVEN